ncbi:MAG: TonB-dependent receptor, partial [Vicinamibacterales bacterium]
MSAFVHGQEARPAGSEGRRLDEALASLQSRGLKIIYSTEVVRPHMRVRREPRVTSLRRILDDFLSENGLIAQDGPGGNLLVVKNPRARLAGNPRSGSTQVPVPRVAPEQPQFAETIDVTNAQSREAGAGPPSSAIRPHEVRSLAGGVENVFRTLQALPGVTGTDELGSRIAVRGGSPDQNLTIMDGIEIHNPFRLVIPGEDLAMVGLASTFNADTIESVEFFPGAFDVGYGDRLSSLLVVKNREGSEAEAFQGSSILTLADANGIVEGKLPRRSSGSWLVSARRSYLDLVAEHVIGVKLPSFQDVHARVSWHPGARQRVLLVGLAGRERTALGGTVEADADHSTRTHNNLVAATFESSVGDTLLLRTVASLSQFADTLHAHERSLDNSRGANARDSISSGGLLEFNLSRDIGVRDLAVRQQLVFAPSSSHWLDLGFETHKLDTRWAWQISGDRSHHEANSSSVRLGTSLPDGLDSTRNSYRFGVWVQDRWELSPRVVLQPGLRVDRSGVTGQTTWSPRLSGTVNVGRAWRLDAAVRAHSQSPGYEKLLQSDYFIDLSPTGALALKAERALQTVAGLQRVFGGGFTARVDAYYKRFSDLLIGRLETERERLTRLAGYDVPATLLTSVPSRPQITTSPLNGATGQAYGLEVHVAHAGAGAGAPLTGWAAYSIGRATRTAYGVTHPFDYDRSHAVTATANLRIGPRVDLSATGRWATGLPRTPVRGVQLALVPDAGDADRDGNAEERVPQRDLQGRPIFRPDLGDVANINSARLPHFGRLDARITYRPTWTGERWAFYMDVLNLLNA